MGLKYRGEIDGLRAVAVLPVILFHAGFGLFGGGYVGVDVFFVISGYLITSILLAELQAGSFTVVGFYERRARRILPALFAVMLATLPFAWLWLAPAEMRKFCNSLIGVSLFSSNILFWQESGYFDTAAELKPLLHTWSLAVEEQFYVFFPLLLMAVWRLGRRRIGVLLAALLVASLLAAEWGLRHDPTGAYYLLHTRGWELLIGALVALVLSARAGADGALVPSSPWLAQLAGLAGLAAIGVSVFLFDRHTPFPGVHALLPTLGTALVILFASPRTAVGALLGNRFCVGIGLLSYSAYLWHQPLLAFARVRSVGAPSEALMGALAVASVALAYLSWRFVERPFRQRRTVPRRAVFLFSGVCLLGFIAVGLGGRLTGGYEAQRLDADRIALRKTAQPSPLRDTCHTLDSPDFTPPARACTYFGSKVTWAVFGDSHAVELAYALAEGLKRDDLGLKHLSYSGCGPVAGRADLGSDCRKWSDAALAHLERLPEVHTVVVVYRMNLHLFGEHEGVYPALPDTVGEAERARTWQSYVALLSRLQAAGKRVVAVLQAPELRKGIDDLVLVDGGPRIVGVERRWWDRRQAFVRAHLPDLPPGVAVVDPAEVLCDAEACYAAGDGQADYFDDDHLSVQGARKVAQQIFKQTAPEARPATE
ncbi:acyltransferase family protein [Zoogloea sp.]|uniref:acyltransferase family protein n=1 Tax=Zoogloea sp. TaxID=49181 RepID=UPI0035B4AF7A